jgi:hypothetical protein
MIHKNIPNLAVTTDALNNKQLIITPIIKKTSGGKIKLYGRNFSIAENGKTSSVFMLNRMKRNQ